MKKEKSKVVFDILIGASSLCTVLCIFFQTAASRLHDRENYDTMHLFMRMVSADAFSQLAETSRIKDMIRWSVMNRPDVHGDIRSSAEADAYFGTVCNPTDAVPRSLAGSHRMGDGMQRFVKDMDSISLRNRVFDTLADLMLASALMLNLLALHYGLKVRDLYKT